MSLEISNLYKLPKDLLVKLISRITLEDQLDLLQKELLQLKYEKGERPKEKERNKIKRLVDLYSQIKYFIVADYMLEFQDKKTFVFIHKDNKGKKGKEEKEGKEGKKVLIQLSFTHDPHSQCQILYIVGEERIFSLRYVDESDDLYFIVDNQGNSTYFFDENSLNNEIGKKIEIDLTEEDVNVAMEIFLKYLEYLKLCSAVLYTEPF